MATRSSPHWRLLSALLRPHGRLLAVLGAVLAGAALLPLAGPQLLRAFIDQAVGGAAHEMLLAIAGGYVLLGVAAQVATVGSTWVANRVGWTATNALREQATAHVLHLDLGYHGRTSPGTLVERIDGDASAITRMFTDIVVQMVGGALTLAGAVVLVAREDWRVGLAMLAFTGAALLVLARLRDRAVAHNSAERAAYADVMGLVEESLEGGEDLRALGARDFALDRHEVVSARHSDALERAEWRNAALWLATMGTFAFGGVLMLGAGYLLHRGGAITVGTVFLLFQYVQVLRRPVESIANQIQEVQRAAAGAGRLSQLLGEQSRVPAGGTTTLPAGPLPLRFEGVSFRYGDDGRPVLADIDLDVPAGSVVGIVGHTGSGKTTLARLALRLLDPSAGCVHLAGEDLRAIETAGLRRRVAVVTQEVLLFDASIRDNVTLFGASSASDEELRDLLEELELGAWLGALDAGLDTVLGEGTGLSAGQAQLLGLGRAFLSDPGLVVLDEASSRVDPATAEQVERALDRLLRGRTALVIAHRLRAVERADVIVVLEHGHIVERGPREALAADPGSRFRQLLEMEGVRV